MGVLWGKINEPTMKRDISVPSGRLVKTPNLLLSTKLGKPLDSEACWLVLLHFFLIFFLIFSNYFFLIFLIYKFNLPYQHFHSQRRRLGSYKEDQLLASEDQRAQPLVTLQSRPKIKLAKAQRKHSCLKCKTDWKILSKCTRRLEMLFKRCNKQWF